PWSGSPRPIGAGVLYAGKYRHIFSYQVQDNAVQVRENALTEIFTGYIFHLYLNRTEDRQISSNSTTTAMKTTTRIQLSVLMFFEFFIWGAWYTMIGLYMANHGMPKLTQWPFTVNPIAAIVAPFFIGLIADRYFATQKVMGILHIIGSIFMFLVPSFTDKPVVFILLLLG